MKIEETKLGNGAKIIGVHMPGSESVMISFGIRTGSRSETKEIGGISHFLEHMLFKGSRDYPTTAAISREADRIGAQYNAYTGKDHTVYHIHTSPENFKVALDIIGDMVTRPILSEAELQKEKGTIIQEAKMYEDNPNLSIFGHIESVLYGDTPLGREIVGSVKSIKATNSKKMKSYFHKYYNGSNSRIVIAGKLPKNYKVLVSKYAARLKPGKKNEWKNDSFSKNKLGLTQKAIEQAHLGIAIPAFSVMENKKYITLVIANILGGYMSARLFTEIREKRGWAYRVWAFTEETTDNGYLGIFGGVKRDKTYESLRIMKNEVLGLAETVTDEEVERAVENLKGSSVLRYKQPEELTNYLITQLLLKDKAELPKTAIAKISKVTKKDVVAVANELFKKENLYLTVIGPFKDKKKFAKILAE